MWQAAIMVMPGERSRFKGDCKACIDMIHAGIVVATSAKRALPRVYLLLLPALEDICLRCVLGMPAHKSAAHVGKPRLSNGELLKQNDVVANGMDDGFANTQLRSRGLQSTKLKFDERRRGSMAPS